MMTTKFTSFAEARVISASAATKKNFIEPP